MMYLEVHQLQRIIVELTAMKCCGPSYAERPPFGFEGRFNFNEEWVSYNEHALLVLI